MVPILNEATWLIKTEAATVAEVDSTVKYDLGLPMGCFELADQISVEVAVDVLEYMHETLGEGYEPCPLFLEWIKAGDYERKTGRGFYDYTGEGVDIPTNTGSDAVAEQLVSVAVNEAAKLVASDTTTPTDVDEAAMLGAGFPKELTALAADIGYDRIHETLSDLHDETAATRYESSPQLTTLGSEGDRNRTI